MAFNISRNIARLDDSQAVEMAEAIVLAIGDALSVDPPQCFVAGNVKQPLSEVVDDAELTGRYGFSKITLFARGSFQGKNLSVTYYRCMSFNQTGQISVSSHHDAIQFQFGGDDNFWQEEADLLIRLNNLVTNDSFDRATLPESLSTGSLEELMLGVSSTHRQMMRDLNKSMVSLETKREELLEEHAKKEAEREEAHARALDEIEAERAALELQTHRSERRRIAKERAANDAKLVLKDAAPEGTWIARWAVFLVSVLSGLVFAGLTYTSLAELGADEALAVDVLAALPEGIDAGLVEDTINRALGPVNWLLLVRSILTALVSIGSFAYAAAWVRGFYLADQEAARTIQRFNEDLIRSNWVIETLLDVRQDEGKDVPEAWLEGVTRNLFDDVRAPSQQDDAALALKALLGVAGGVKVGPEGFEATLNGKQARRLSKAVSSGNE